MAADARGGERRARPRVQRGSRLLFLLGLFDFLLRASVLGHVILPYKWIITGGAGFSLPTPAWGSIFFHLCVERRVRAVPASAVCVAANPGRAVPSGPLSSRLVPGR